MNNQPIGIFDSGVGGLCIASSIRSDLPNETICYVADALHAPYGNKDASFILHRSRFIVYRLMALGVKAVVVACNTATVTAIHQLRTEFPLPFIGVEPGVKPAVSISKTGRVGVLATAQTIASDSFKRLVGRFSGQASILVKACPGFVDLVETARIDDDASIRTVRQHVTPLLNEGVDTIVLGCTHFEFLAPVIRQVAGPEIAIVSTRQAVSKEVARRLKAENLLASGGNIGRETFFSSRVNGETTHLFHKLWGTPVTVFPI